MQLVGRKREFTDLMNEYVIKCSETELLLIWFIFNAYDGVELRNAEIAIKVDNMRKEIENICGIKLNDTKI